MSRALYFRPPHSGPDCSTPRSARLRQHRFDLGYEQRTTPPELAALAEQAAALLESEPDPSLGRARALAHVVEHAPLTIERDTCLLGGEDPFFFNLLLPALQRDPHGRPGQTPPDELSGRMRSGGVFYASCFEGHITPGLHQILEQGVAGILTRIDEALGALPDGSDEQRRWYEAARLSCASLLRFAERLRAEALRLADGVDAERAAELREAADTLARVPAQPAAAFREALQSYWLAYVLVTLEMGGCCPGGGLGLGRMDQFLLPYYRHDLEAGRLTREQALELLEIFLLGFRHIDYYTGHQIYTPGSHGSLGGVTPLGDDASNELTELILEASLRIAMPAPYLSLRLHRDAPERWWQAAAAYVAGGLGFPISNDEALIPAFLKHGRAPEDARDYICSCCYENTIPGREAFHPNGCYLNLPLVLELALNQGRSLLTGEALGAPTPQPGELTAFEAVVAAFEAQLAFTAERLVELVNAADRSHMAHRRYPLMSCFIDDCLGRGLDVCAGGARYNLTGCIVAGLPNVVNALAAVRRVVFEGGQHKLSELVEALQADFEGHERLRRELLAAPKWGNDDPHCDDLAARVSRRLYEQFRRVRNPRGGRWQLALYSFVANRSLGAVVGASADGRRARELLTRNLDPTWGTDRHGPTSVLMSLSNLDYTCFPDGTSVNLNFDPAHVCTPAGLDRFAGFLKAFVRLGVGTMQISMVGRETLLDAQANPERYPHLMVKVAGYSARFVDLDEVEQTELISRTVQKLG
ncbi:MAG: hypothetical protein HYU66_13940 [Armatimonadetes bacterium]|nr:hypothetical protein [Armatimonadota bacterium]